MAAGGLMAGASPRDIFRLSSYHAVLLTRVILNDAQS